jgi:hypothetical protein
MREHCSNELACKLRFSSEAKTLMPAADAAALLQRCFTATCLRCLRALLHAQIHDLQPHSQSPAPAVDHLEINLVPSKIQYQTNEHLLANCWNGSYCFVAVNTNLKRTCH